MGDPQTEAESQPTIKICDFTTAQFMDPTSEYGDDYKVSDSGGTFLYKAPEKVI